MSKATTNPKRMWKGSNLMIGCNEVKTDDLSADGNDLSKFFCRFERPKLSFDKPKINNSSEQPFTLEDVTAVSSCKASTIYGPDNILGWFTKILQL